VGRAAMKDGSVAAAVMPMMLKKEDIFADIPKNFNAIESQSKTLGAATFVGQGAGCLPTAHAVVQNVVDIWKNQDPEINPKDHVHIDNTKHTGRFYIHSVKSAFMNDIIDRYVGENTFLTKEISLLEMNMMVQTAADPALFIAEVAE
ncbi:MAG: hypothetical protein IKD69_16270, partial [Solobacterium sp.]|nr:hypothetical protein [Solobacterium sp.]